MSNTNKTNKQTTFPSATFTIKELAEANEINKPAAYMRVRKLIEIGELKKSQNVTKSVSVGRPGFLYEVVQSA